MTLKSTFSDFQPMVLKARVTPTAVLPEPPLPPPPLPDEDVVVAALVVMAVSLAVFVGRDGDGRHAARAGGGDIAVAQGGGGRTLDEVGANQGVNGEWRRRRRAGRRLGSGRGAGAHLAGCRRRQRGHLLGLYQHVAAGRRERGVCDRGGGAAQDVVERHGAGHAGAAAAVAAAGGRRRSFPGSMVGADRRSCPAAVTDTPPPA